MLKTIHMLGKWIPICKAEFGGENRCTGKTTAELSIHILHQESRDLVHWLSNFCVQKKLRELLGMQIPRSHLSNLLK